MSEADDYDWKPGATLETRRFKMGRCLNCGTKLSGITGPPGKPEPATATMVCAYCGHIMEWDGKRLTELSDAVAGDVAGNPDVLAAVKLAGAFQREVGPFGAACAACKFPAPIGRIRCEKCGQPLVFPKSFVCPDCKAESFNLNDITQRYCGRCHAFK
jgi:hypothetical protein